MIKEKTKTNFNMQLTVTQRKIMDFITEVVFEGTNYSKADAVNELFRGAALKYLCIEDENCRIDDETLFALLQEEKMTKDLDLFSVIGAEKFENAITENKSKGIDTDYYEKLLIRYKKVRGVK